MEIGFFIHTTSTWEFLKGQYGNNGAQEIQTGIQINTIIPSQEQDHMFCVPKENCNVKERIT